MGKRRREWASPLGRRCLPTAGHVGRRSLLSTGAAMVPGRQGESAGPSGRMASPAAGERPAGQRHRQAIRILAIIPRRIPMVPVAWRRGPPASSYTLTIISVYIDSLHDPARRLYGEGQVSKASLAGMG